MQAWTAVCADVQASHPKQLSSERVAADPRANPMLALLRLLISSAFRDAKRCAHGEPTDIAMAAVEWLLEDPPSKYVTPVGSFSWCCGWLGFDCETIRERGLPAVKCEYMCGHDRTKGLGEVFAVWAAHRSAYLAAGGHDERAERSDLIARARQRRDKRRKCNRRTQSASRASSEGKTSSGAQQTQEGIFPRPRILALHLGNDVRSRYSSYSQFCRIVEVPPMTPQLWRLHAL